ncbi:response regulator [Secundilactobacillus kimchicus]|uniref:DNA-binding domain-containing protein n=1 Tax=Secundilactobacillus kimchicus TaxID=528209 RepID=UPI0007052815|nr:DNA-binding domain-containing protein [Secundilactobacillus kimchicus]MBT9671924.1 response regulator [Secundilactobacillus kimchicus]
MNFYIVDDDPAVPMILRRIIEQNMNNTVVGESSDSTKAFAALAQLNVDIVLIDLLMPGMSGIELINKLRQIRSDLHFIMISQVRDSELRAQAYEAGIEFFIDKPINLIEVKTVTEKVIQSIQMSHKLSNIQSLVSGVSVTDDHQTQQLKNNQKTRILGVLRFLGIASEKGASDILAITQMMTDQNTSFQDLDLRETYQISDQERKVLFQRLRRAIRTGLANLANMYLDDMGDEIITEYANSLYEYKNVRTEMLFLQGKRSSGGKVSVQHFLNGLVQLI